jgi:hypothetical protein
MPVVKVTFSRQSLFTCVCRHGRRHPDSGTPQPQTMAKDLVRTRAQITKFYGMKCQMQVRPCPPPPTPHPQQRKLALETHALQIY